MEYKEFEELLKKAQLKKGQFAELVSMHNSSVGNWNKSGKVPDWVKSWLDNYIKAKKVDDIKRMICE